MVLAGLIGRLPIGMLGLGMTLLIVAETGSYALAGATSAAITLSIALVSPFGSRLADRIGQPRAIPLLMAVSIPSFLLLTTAVALAWPVWLWFLFSAVGGAAWPNLGVMTRTRWVGIARNGAERSSAFSLETMADEFAFIVGPVLASALAFQLFPAAAVLAGLAFTVVGGLALALLRGTAPAPAARETTGGGHVLRYPGMWSMTFVMLALGGVFGGISVSTIAFAEQTDPALTGVLLGSFAVGSFLSALLVGRQQRTWRLTSQVRLATITLTVALTPLAFVSEPWLYALVAFIAGLNISAVVIGSFGLIERMVPNARLTEGMTVMVSGMSLGVAAATTASGVIIDASGPSQSLMLAAGSAALAAVVFWSRSGRIAAIESATDAAEATVVPAR